MPALLDKGGSSSCFALSNGPSPSCLLHRPLCGNPQPNFEFVVAVWASVARNLGAVSTTSSLSLRLIGGAVVLWTLLVSLLGQHAYVERHVPNVDVAFWQECILAVSKGHLANYHDITQSHP